MEAAVVSAYCVIPQKWLSQKLLFDLLCFTLLINYSQYTQSEQSCTQISNNTKLQIPHMKLNIANLELTIAFLYF